MSTVHIKKFSGYISNKKELKALCPDAKDDSDLISAAYNTWGENFMDHIHGMFAFVLYDEANDTLMCIRDRFGNESLYYYVTADGEFIYGLSINEILESGKYTKIMNHRALELFLTYSYLPGQDTFFEGIKKVMPGFILTYKSGKISTKRYWKVEYKGDASKSIEEYADLVNDTLNTLIDDWKQPGEVYGNFLSGGVDSAYLAALTKPKYTFSTAYENKEFDESGLAAESSKFIGSEHVKVYITPEQYFGVIPEAMKSMEQPLADASTIAFYCACKGAKEYVDICYSGEGADELFCGYHAYVRRLANLADPNYTSAPVENYYIGNTKVMSEAEKEDILLEYDGSLTPLQLANSLYEYDENTDDITKMWLCDLNVWFEGDIMLNAEKMSKANGLIARTPFLDTRLYEVACQIPSEYKASASESKIVFRKAASRMIPDEVAFRKKLGFAVPARVWMMEDKYLNMIKEMFESEDAAKFFKTDKIVALLDEEHFAKPDNWRKVWSIYVFLVWYKQYFN
ncbi:MAG: asparagine synthetase B [Lachnospiraceae bacterium]|nr:asparagine synthetase B [Lachnospiraceae bacterium]